MAKGKRKVKKTRAAAASASTPMKGKRPDGSISSGIYDTVEKLTADGFLTVDGRVIYQMTGFTLE